MTSTARRNSKFKIQTGIQSKRFIDFEWVGYFRRAVLAQSLRKLNLKHPALNRVRAQLLSSNGNEAAINQLRSHASSAQPFLVFLRINSD